MFKFGLMDLNTAIKTICTINKKNKTIINIPMSIFKATKDAIILNNVIPNDGTTIATNI